MKRILPLFYFLTSWTSMSMMAQVEIHPTRIMMSPIVEGERDSAFVGIDNALPFDVNFKSISVCELADDKSFQPASSSFLMNGYGKAKTYVHFSGNGEGRKEGLLVFLSRSRGVFTTELSGQVVRKEEKDAYVIPGPSDFSDRNKTGRVIFSEDTVVFRNVVSTDSLIYRWMIYNSSTFNIHINEIIPPVDTDFILLDNPEQRTLEPGEYKVFRLLFRRPFEDIRTIQFEGEKWSKTLFVKTGTAMELDEWIAQNIQIYRVPTVDHIRIMSPVQELIGYQLEDGTGNIIWGGTFRSQLTLDTRPLPWGNYYLKLYRNTNFFTQPIVKTSR